MVNVLLCCTGSVASVKVAELLARLREDHTVKLVITEHSRHFLPVLDTLGTLGQDVLRDQDEWSAYKTRGDPVVHIELRRWADLAVVAPLDANTLAKMATGLADNLLTCVLRAWDFSRPVVVAPAMNTLMWQHPVTAPQLETLRGWGVTVVPPVEKTLVCGDKGVGAMASVDTIVDVVRSLSTNKS